MQYFFSYQTPDQFDDILMTSDGSYLTGLSFSNQNNIKNLATKSLSIFQETCHWLDIYFNGQKPTFNPRYKTNEITPFRKEIQDLLLKIPFGETTTYGNLAKKLAETHHLKKMSAQAVGGAVGWNPICIIIPCHRVLGQTIKLLGMDAESKIKSPYLDLSKAIFLDRKNFILKTRLTITP